MPSTTSARIGSQETLLLTVQLRYEHDIVLARQRARQIAALFGFEQRDQTRIATAVSELARNAFEYAGGGKTDFRLLHESPSVLEASVQDKGPGIADRQAILEGRYISTTGMGLGIIGAKRLMDRFELDEPLGGGTRVRVGLTLPRNQPPVSAQKLADVAAVLARSAPESPMEEMQQQNQELLRALDDLQTRQTEIQRLNGELEETNRGVMALYAELDDRAEQLRTASDTKSRFLSNMSHEFRTPLAAIISLSGLLIERIDGDLTDEQEKQVSFIQNSARELMEIVNDLLDIAKIEAGRLVINPSWFEVTDLFGALRGMFRPLLLSKHVDLIFEDTGDVPTVYSDEGKVGQILRNFISNALKFTPAGEVRVSAVLLDTDYVEFAVRDTGVGIPEEMQERIFEEFVQVEHEIQRSVKGTGLGLPLCRRLAELLGGRVTLESKPGAGSTFRVILPRRLSDSTSSQPETAGNGREVPHE
jgi:signal transduction histidine kinase